MVSGEFLRAEQSARFFTVAEQNDQIVSYRRTSTQSADGFQDNDQARTVVACARAFSDGIVVGHKHDGAAVGLTWERGDDVVNQTGMNVASVMNAADALFDMDVASKSAELLHQIFAYSNGRIAPNRVRLLCDLREISHGARSGKNV